MRAKIPAESAKIALICQLDTDVTANQASFKKAKFVLTLMNVLTELQLVQKMKIASTLLVAFDASVKMASLLTRTVIVRTSMNVMVKTTARQMHNARILSDLIPAFAEKVTLVMDPPVKILMSALRLHAWRIQNALIQRALICVTATAGMKRKTVIASISMSVLLLLATREQAVRIQLAHLNVLA